MSLESYEKDEPVRLLTPIVKDMRKEQNTDPRPILANIYGENVIHGPEAERAFETMKKSAAQKGVNLNDLAPDVQKKIERKGRAAFGQLSGGASTSNVFDTFFSPFRIRPSVETPTKRQDLNQWYRAYAKYDPMVGMAIQLHSEFPLSNFEIDHEDSTIREFFNQIKEDLNLSQFIVNMAQEYYTVGEAIPFGMMDDDKNPQMWEQFVLLDPDYVRINTHRMVRGKRPYTISLVPDKDLQRIVSNGPNDPVTGSLYKELPPDVIQQVKTGKEVPLNPIQVSHFKRTGNYFNVRGESIISRVIYWLMYRDKLLDAQYAVADRHVSPKEFYKIGTEENPADSGELAAFAEALQAQWTNPNQAIIWHHALQVQWEGASGKVLPLVPEFEFVEKQILTGLGMSKAFVHGENVSYANASVGLDVLISRYLTFRQSMEKWILNAVYAPICHLHKIYKPRNEPIDERFKFNTSHRHPWLPKIIWSKGELRNDLQFAELLMRIADKKKISYDTILRKLNINPDVESKNIINDVVRETQRATEIAQQMKALGTPALTTPGLGGGMGPGSKLSLPDIANISKPNVSLPSADLGEEAVPEAGGIESGTAEIPEVPGGPMQGGPPLRREPGVASPTPAKPIVPRR